MLSVLYLFIERYEVKETHPNNPLLIYSTSFHKENKNYYLHIKTMDLA